VSRRTPWLFSAGSSFDAVVCDLAHPEYGWRPRWMTWLMVVRFSQRSSKTHPGTPIIAFSAYGTVEIMQDLLRRARQEDFLGEGTPREMLVFYSKDQLPDCVALLHGFAESVETLGQIEIGRGTREYPAALGGRTHPSRICASTRRLGGEGLAR